MSATEVDTFGAKVVEYRERLGMLQNELAKKVGLSKSHLNRIEKGTRRRPKVETVLRMIKALRLTRGEAKELCDLAELSPLVLENISFEEDGQGFALVKIEEDEAEKKGARTSDTSIPSIAQKAAAPSSKQPPLSQSDLDVLAATGTFGSPSSLKDDQEQQLPTLESFEEQVRQIITSYHLPYAKRMIAQKMSLEAIRIICWGLKEADE
jgi:DNA-binding XRE family transcriptional regulator